jgi:glutamate-ammonia-ligase adenylyltransferase
VADAALPDPQALHAAVGALCPGVPDDELRDFLLRVGPEYLAREPVERIARHVRMAAELQPTRAARVAVEPAGDGLFDVAVVAYDFFAEFAMLCGLLTASGLDIVSGHAHTFAPVERRALPRRGALPLRRPQPAPSRKIVDVFRVRPREGRAPDAAALEASLLELLGLVNEGRVGEARERLGRRLVESLERLSGGPEPAAALLPVTIEFDDEAQPPWTALRVRGPDTPAFLYALGSALALRGVYVHAVFIESVEDEARDVFLVSRRDGSKIDSEDERARLRLAVAVIKQFTHFLPFAPDPGLALKDFDQLLDRLLAMGPDAVALFSSPEGLRELARLLGSSAFLWEDFLRLQFDHLLPVLGAWRERAVRPRAELQAALGERLAACATDDERKAALNAFKDEEMLLVDMKHLLDPGFGLIEFEEALSDLAETVVAQAVDLLQSRLVSEHGRPLLESGAPCPLAVFGLGKFGGRELGFASDLELLVVYGGAGRTERTRLENGGFFEELVRELQSSIVAREQGIFRIDLRLRPHGKKGPLASPLQALRDYYSNDGGAAPFERQALLKLRFVACDPGLGRAVEAVRDAFCWSGAAWDQQDALHLRERQAKELVPPGRFSVKMSRGGLVEVEYAVQYLQLQHGGERPGLRTPSTLIGLERLRVAALLSDAEATGLREAYVFWRRVADGLRMVSGQATDLLLPEPGSEEWGLLARRLGYSAGDWAASAAALRADADRHRDAVVAIFDAKFRA